MLSHLIGRPEEGGSLGGPVGTAEEAAAGEVTDRMSTKFHLSVDLFISTPPPPDTPGSNHCDAAFFSFVCFSCSEAGPVDPLKVEQVSEFCPTSL